MDVELLFKYLIGGRTGFSGIASGRKGEDKWL